MRSQLLMYVFHHKIKINTYDLNDMSFVRISQYQRCRFISFIIPLLLLVSQCVASLCSEFIADGMRRVRTNNVPFNSNPSALLKHATLRDYIPNIFTRMYMEHFIRLNTNFPIMISIVQNQWPSLAVCTRNMVDRLNFV